MSRVNVSWIIAVLAVELATLSAARAHSCHEVKTAFQVRQIGPLKWVPETPATDVDLSVCKHTGPSCCTRRMEESYRAAVQRDTTQNIRSNSIQLRYIINGHATAFQDVFQSLLSFSQEHLIFLFERVYTSLLPSISPHIMCLFTDLSQYLQGTGNVSVETAVQCFFDSLFPLVHTRIINPDMAESVSTGASGDSQLGDCLRMTRPDINPFGPHPRTMAAELVSALQAGRALSIALAVGSEVMNVTETMELSKECVRALLRMNYCSHCQGLTLIRACSGYCLNVMRGCLASLSEIHMPWRQYITVLQDLAHMVAGEHSLELALLRIKDHVEEAIIHAQLNGLRLTATVDKVCGHSSNTSSIVLRRFPSSSVTAPPPPANSSQEVPGADKIGMLAHLQREFIREAFRHKPFFNNLPEMLCNGEFGVEEMSCWSGDDVVQSYTARVVSSGVRAQRQNPEVRVRGFDPVLMEVKAKLEQFNQEIQEVMPRVGQGPSWDETGSTMETSGDCDDEDGCESSGNTASTPTLTEADLPKVHESPSVRNKPKSDAPVSLASFIIVIISLWLQHCLT
ncbi:glypican-5-like isoform X3 [Misgurnus anguillicaudatus]|uniref:glypican-5-like isoform X3 n=1 Tax=Misgurnus anguillicaudatus TaxID=75329 RepID=UPI003CCFD09E